MVSLRGDMRVVAISDLHIDIAENRDWLAHLCDQAHDDEILILAGDLASKLSRIESGLALLARSYSQVFFVPGNHDLWVEAREPTDSLQRFREIQSICSTHGVAMRSRDILGEKGHRVVSISPLLSWYCEPDEGDLSLFLSKPGEDESLAMWADRVRIRWPDSLLSPASYFLGLNAINEAEDRDIPIISFSHFLPRQELIFSSSRDRVPFGGRGGDRAPRFNFSRVAGTVGIERQLRMLGSSVHIHGHQHRNRDRMIDGVRYVSHCLGYPQERAAAGISAKDVKPVEVFHY